MSMLIENDTIKVLVVDDHTILREGIKNLLSSTPNIEVVGEAADGRKAVEMASALKPDVILMDITLPSLNGIEATRRIIRDNHDIKVLCLTMHDNEDYLSQILQAGASGYILKHAASDELLSAIELVNKGQSYLYPAAAKKLIGAYLKKSDPGRIDGLTGREQEVLILIAEGKTNKQIAAELCLSVKTVEAHRAHILEKLDLHDRVELVRYAIRRGLIEA